jgi:hypothetical protein
MKIETTIKKADFNDLVQISSNVTPILSFWGVSRINVAGYQGIAPIDSLAAKVMELVESKKFEYSEQERESGNLIAKNINKLYLNSDKQVNNSNILTRIFCVFISIYNRLSHIKSIPGSTKSFIRKKWDDDNFYGLDGFNKVFNYYTRDQYFQKFNHYPDILSVHLWSNDIPLAVGDDL